MAAFFENLDWVHTNIPNPLAAWDNIQTLFYPVLCPYIQAKNSFRISTNFSREYLVFG
jgi:hypothetical protein